MTDSLFPSWPYYDEEQLEAVDKVLRSGNVNYWTGSECRKFEEEFAEYCGVEYAVAVSNGTVALELALIALGIGPGDEVIVTSRTFIASASAVVRVGATPIFADIDEISQNITVETVREAFTERTRAIIAVHFSGWPCDMDPILEFSHEYNLRVIEDCAQSHGARYKGKRVGSLGDIAAFSFCQDKIITTGGEGGMVTTNNEKLWKAMWSYKDHGKSYDAVYRMNHPAGFRWVHESIGTNYRMTEMQAALGRIQLNRLDTWLELRRKNAEYLNTGLCAIPGLRICNPPKEIQHAFYKYYLFIKPECLESDWTRTRIMTEIDQDGIPSSTGGCSEVYLEKAFAVLGLEPKARLPVAKKLGDTSLMFLVHPTLNKTHMSKTVDVIKTVFYRAVKRHS